MDWVRVSNWFNQSNHSNDPLWNKSNLNEMFTDHERTNASADINHETHVPDGLNEMSQPNAAWNVRAEEIGLVVLVLILWVGAVALFVNRWGKIRMLEPYQPKFHDVPRASLLPASTTHRPSYPLLEPCSQLTWDPTRRHSRLNMSPCCDIHPACNHHCEGRFPQLSSPSLLHEHYAPYCTGQQGHNRGCPRGHARGHIAANRPRQNSVVVYATSQFCPSSRKVQSAMDLQTLVLNEEAEEHALHCYSPAERPATVTASASNVITCV